MRKEKKVAVLQSNYLPWKGYFDLIHDVDLFIFYDDVQYTKNDWRNRNLVKPAGGQCWLTVPVGKNIDRNICDVDIPDQRWQQKQWKTIVQGYAKAPFLDRYRSFLDDVFLEKQWKNLSNLNQYTIKYVSKEHLGIKTKFDSSSNYHVKGDRLERLIALLKKAGATSYLSGPSARDYIDEAAFKHAGIELIYKDYSDYPEYPQLTTPFSHFVSVLDLLLMKGEEAPWYIWGWRNSSSMNLEELL